MKKKKTNEINRKHIRNRIIMYKQVLTKVATAGTLTLLGYEIGSKSDKVEVQKPKIEEPMKANSHDDVIIFTLGVLLVLVIAIAAKIFLKRRSIV